MLNMDAQPPSLINADLRKGKGVSELIGLAKGVLADGMVTSREIDAVLDWLKNNQELWCEYPVNLLVQRVHRFLLDKYIDDDEAKELAQILAQLTGFHHGSALPDGMAGSTSLPLCTPAPLVTFTGHEFVFTGKFVFGPRKVCEHEVIKLGGHCHSNVRDNTRYLVIGTIASRDWLHTTLGSKIVEAVERRDRGLPISIISEDHWAAALP